MEPLENLVDVIRRINRNPQQTHSFKVRAIDEDGKEVLVERKPAWGTIGKPGPMRVYVSIVETLPNLSTGTFTNETRYGISNNKR